MQAAVYDRYGDANVVQLKDIPRPEITDNEILVRVYATTVSSPDWRFRASVFPPSLWLMGRLTAGLFRPRNKVLGVEFSGRVVAVGGKVTKFKLGDRVFGFSGSGAHAEYLRISENAAIAHMPAPLDYDAAAAIPFGALSALVFMRDFARVQPGQRVLVYGASSGVGSHAVQFAKYFGAQVTGVASGENLELVKSLGADHVIDRLQQDYWALGGDYDLVFDTTGKSNFSEAKHVLGPKGVFLPIVFGWTEVFQALLTGRGRGRRVMIGISGDSQTDLEFVAQLLQSGAIQPVIDSRYDFTDIRKAHLRVEGGHKRGAVVVNVVKPDVGAAVA